MTLVKILVKDAPNAAPRIYYAESYIRAQMIADLFPIRIGCDRAEGLGTMEACNYLEESRLALYAYFRRSDDWSEVRPIIDKATSYDSSWWSIKGIQD